MGLQLYRPYRDLCARGDDDAASAVFGAGIDRALDRGGVEPRVLPGDPEVDDVEDGRVGARRQREDEQSQRDEKWAAGGFGDAHRNDPAAGADVPGPSTLLDR